MGDKNKNETLVYPPGGPRRKELVKLVRPDEVITSDAEGKVQIIKIKEPEKPKKGKGRDNPAEK